MRYYLIAGEASGDLHGSLLMEGLTSRDPAADFRFFGGDRMAAAGGVLAFDYRDTAVMGVVEVLAQAGRLRRRMDACKADILAYAPDVLILIDYPGFNLRMARFAHRHGLKVFYYIAPKVWASREGRIRQLRRYVDKLCVIFPFEVEWFRRRGIDVVYEGNPLVDHIDSVLAAAPSREEFLRQNGLDSRPLIALLPGSRMQEIRFLAPRFREVAGSEIPAGNGAGHDDDGTAHDYGGAAFAPFQYVIAAAPGIATEVYDKYFPGIAVVYGQTYELLKHSAAAAIASGTASLEAAVIGTPQVVCYGTNPLTYRIARALMKVRYVSLANIIMDKPIFKELLQGYCTSEAIATELERLVSNAGCRTQMQQDYAAVRSLLGSPGSAERIAASI